MPYFLIALLGAGFFAYFRYEARAPIRPVHYEVAIPHLPESLEGFRILHLTDFHARLTARDCRRLRRWLRREPVDVVLVTGDILRRGDLEGGSEAIACLGTLAESFPVYAATGNHDYPQDDAQGLLEALRDVGVTLLLNTHHLHREGLVIAGLEDPQSKRHNFAQALCGIPSEAFILLLAHTPTVFHEAALRGIPLTLSGHTHGGQGRIPWIGPLWTPGQCGLFPRFDRGIYREGDSVLVLSSGIGTSGPPLRFMTPPEACWLRLTREEAETKL